MPPNRTKGALDFNAKLYTVHHIYGKHTPGSKIYKKRGLFGAVLCVWQCTCGTWMYGSEGYRTEQLYGLVGKDFIYHYPELATQLKEYYRSIERKTLEPVHGATPVAPATWNEVWRAVCISNMKSSKRQKLADIIGGQDGKEILAYTSDGRRKKKAA